MTRNNVLFLCTGNAGRSIIAEAILNRIGGDRFQAFSAGSRPHGVVHPGALRVLASYGYGTETLRSKSWNEFTQPSAPLLDFVVTVCDSIAHEACPVWSGRPVALHFGVPDPTAAASTEAALDAAFAQTYCVLHERLSAFCALPHDSLDRLSLQQCLGG